MNLEAFKSRLAYEGQSLPKFVHSEFEAYLRCGILRHGFARVYCKGCSYNRLVAFSCKRRGFCPSCNGRRMAQSAIHQVQHIFPNTRVRQWVLTLPPQLRLYLAYRHEAMTDTLDILIKSLRYFYRTQCLPKSSHPPALYDPTTLRDHHASFPNDIGAVTAIQRFNSALSLFPHFHALVSDGLFTTSTRKEDFAFHKVPLISDDHILDILIHFKYRLLKRFIHRGYLRPISSDPNDGFALYWGYEEPNDELRLLLKCYASSTHLTHAFGPQSGQPLQMEISDEPSVRFKGPLCVEVDGFNLHAATTIESGQRERLEQLCRYIQRPPLAKDRLEYLEDGSFYYGFKRAWANGVKGIRFTGADLLERLAALVPPPRKNITRYHGVFAPSSKLRKSVTQHTQDQYLRTQRLLIRKSNKKKRNYWCLWALLMRHVFREEVLTCPRCQSSMQMIALIDHPEAIHAMLGYDDEARAPPPLLNVV